MKNKHSGIRYVCESSYACSCVVQVQVLWIAVQILAVILRVQSEDLPFILAAFHGDSEC